MPVPCGGREPFPPDKQFEGFIKATVGLGDLHKLQKGCAAAPAIAPQRAPLSIFLRLPRSSAAATFFVLWQSGELAAHSTAPMI